MLLFFRRIFSPIPSRLSGLLAILAMGLLLGFALQLGWQYRKLEEAFARTSEFVPTRIYSDLTRVAPPLERAALEQRLRSLGYTWSAASGPSPAAAKTPTLKFRLHPIDYPEYLLPEGDPTREMEGAEILATFADRGPRSPLVELSAGGHPIEHLFLEPELVATLARGSETIRSPLRFAEIPAALWQAILAAEDQHFLEHNGLDPRGLARAFLVNLRRGELAQGGSTITMQLVKNLRARRGKNLFLKFNELFLALLLEARHEKERILERYLNEVYLGQVGNLEVHGVAEGARHFFGKSLDALNLGEIALMAGLIRGPAHYSPYRHRERAVERQRWVLRKMVETGRIAEEELRAALREPLRLAPPKTATNQAPFFTDYVKADLLRQLGGKLNEEEIDSAGFRIYTTLDPRLNFAAREAVAAGVLDVEKRLGQGSGPRLEGALAAVDPTTGFLRALVGGRSYADSSFNRILNMRRQVGSTFKPFVVLAALERGEDDQGVPYGPGYPLEDAPWTLFFDRGRQSWSPRNHEKNHQGWISLRAALALSINTAAARLGHAVGTEAILSTARALGIESPLPAFPSLSLGIAELTPIELLSAYATIANHGVRAEITAIRGVTRADGSLFARFIANEKSVISAASADLLASMLESVFQEGTARSASKLGFKLSAAGKTGTTSNHRDAWFAGFTPQLVAVTWVGFDQAPGTAGGGFDGPAGLTGAGAALPIWTRFMRAAHEGLPELGFGPSPHLAQVKIDKKTGLPADPGCPEEQVLTELYPVEALPPGESCAEDWPEPRPTATN